MDPLSRIKAQRDLTGKGISDQLERLLKRRLEDTGNWKGMVISGNPWGASLVYHSQAGEQRDACCMPGPGDRKQAA